MFVLASASPRRKELLEQIGAKFYVRTSDVKEIMGNDYLPEELVRENAVAKAMSVAKEFPVTYVLGADTIVYLENYILGKPHSVEESKSMLKMLAGERHFVTTGIAWVRDSKVFTDTVTTAVYFGNMSDKEINDYVLTGEPMDKAGAYAIQGKAAVYIERIEGSFSNVVGLPIYAMIRLARKVGVNIYDYNGEGFAK